MIKIVPKAFAGKVDSQHDLLQDRWKVRCRNTGLEMRIDRDELLNRPDLRTLEDWIHQPIRLVKK